MRIVSECGKVFGEITTMPGCDVIAISHGVFSAPYRQKGAGSKAHAERLALMRSLGYEMCVCTVADTNTRQVAIMKKFLWSKVSTFVSTKTGNTVSVWIKNLSEEDFISTRGKTLLESATK